MSSEHRPAGQARNALIIALLLLAVACQKNQKDEHNPHRADLAFEVRYETEAVTWQETMGGPEGKFGFLDENRAAPTASRTYTQFVQQPGDGFIHQDSQTGANRFTVRNSNWNAVAVEALGANHLEQRNHPSMDVVFRNIWDVSVAGYPPFFGTQRR